MITNQIKKIQKKINRLLKPPPNLSLSQWADAKRYLSKEASSEPGKWRTDRAPFQREVLDTVTNPLYEKVVVMAATQLFKTELLLNTIGYYAEQDPSPILMVQPTLDVARAFSTERLTPMLRDTPVLKKIFETAKTRDTNNTVYHKKFPGGFVNVSGANSPASLVMRPVRVLLLDEVDRYPDSAGHEGDPIALAEKRTATYFNRKIVITSSPTIKGESKIEHYYEQSDKRVYLVCCPKCSHYQELRWQQLKWERDKDGRHLPDTVKYECEHCQYLIPESQKYNLLKNGYWQKTAESLIAGFKINELYSPWKTWAEMVRAFLFAKDKPEILKTFINTSLAETYEVRGDAPNWERLYHRREPYQFNVVPNKALFLVAGVDIQKDRIEVEVVGYGKYKESWSIDYRVFEGNTDKENSESWRKLDAMINNEEFLHESGQKIKPLGFGVDTGYNSQIVYAWLRKQQPGRVFGVHGGKANMPYAIGAPSYVDVTINGKKISNGCKIWMVGVTLLKSELYGWLRSEVDDDGNYPPGYCHFPEYDPEFFKQMTSEDYYAGKGFKKNRDRNEALDCRIYARAASIILGIDRFSDEHWDKLGEKFTNTHVNTPIQSRGRTRRVLSKGVRV